MRSGAGFFGRLEGTNPRAGEADLLRAVRVSVPLRFGSGMADRELEG